MREMEWKDIVSLSRIKLILPDKTVKLINKAELPEVYAKLECPPLTIAIDLHRIKYIVVTSRDPFLICYDEKTVVWQEYLDASECSPE